MFYLALGCFISYLPYAVLTKVLSSGIVAGVDRPVGGGRLVTMASGGVTVHTPDSPMIEAAYAFLQEAGVIARRHRSRHLTVQPCRAEVIYCITAEHRAAVFAQDDHRQTAALIQQGVQKRLAEKFL